MRRAIPLALSLVFFVSVPQPAGAASCVAPPGTAAIDEYCEVVTAPGSKPRPAPVRRATVDRLLRKHRARVLLAIGGARIVKRGDPAAAAGRSEPPTVVGGTASGVRSSLFEGIKVGSTFIALLLVLTVTLMAWAALARRRESAS